MTFLKIILLLLSFVGYVTYISKRACLSLVQAPFIFCCFISLFLYAFAIAGQLLFGSYLALVLGLILLLVSIYKKYITTSTFKNIHFSFLLFIFPYAYLYFIIARDFKFLGWDEFSFWASSQKLIFETGELYKENSPIFLKSYPPGQQLFQYYLTKMTVWSEKNVLFAQIFWVLSGLMCVAGTLINRPLHAAIVFLTSCAFLYYFNFSFSTLYSDPLLGVCFAACIALAYQGNKGSLYPVVLLLSLAVLIVIKEIGIFLSLIALAIFFISRFTSLSGTCVSLTKRVMPAVGTTLMLATGLFVVMKTWAWYLGTINSIRLIAMPNLSSFFESPLRERTTLTVVEFNARLYKSGYLAMAEAFQKFSPSILIFVLSVTAISLLLISISGKQERLKISLTLLILLCGVLTYIGVLLFSFLVLFTEYEGVRLASFERYLSSYTFAWFLVVYALCLVTILKLQVKYIAPIQVTLIAIVLYFSPKLFFQEVHKIESVGPVNDLRVSVDHFANVVKKHITKDEKVYFIAQNTNGLERAVFTYAMLPFTSSMDWCWTLGKKYFEGDVWTCDRSLEDVLKGYTYLALYKADDQFWKINGTLFDPTAVGSNSGTFKIHRQPDGTIQSFSKID